MRWSLVKKAIVVFGNARRIENQKLRHSWGERTLVMGIVNVTPDSFSGDGITDAPKAVEYAIEQINNGADLLDFGAESTRPGHQSVPVNEELKRLLPVLDGLRKRSECIVSVDTTKAKVLEAAVNAGADILNSIWGLTDELLSVVGDLALPVVLMHNKSEPKYAGSVITEVCEHLARQADLAISAGIKRRTSFLIQELVLGKQQNIICWSAFSG